MLSFAASKFPPFRLSVARKTHVAGHGCGPVIRSIVVRTIGFHTIFYPNPMQASAFDGYHYTGNAACSANDGSGTCNCQEGSCSN